MLHVHSVEVIPGQAHESAIGAPPLLGESIGIFPPGLLTSFMLLPGILRLLELQRVLKRVAGCEQLRGDGTLSAACGSSRIQAAAACRVMPGGRLGAMKSQLPPVCIFAASFMLRTISKGAER